MIDIFYKSHANIEAADYDNRTVAHLACSEDNVQLVEYLVKQTNFNFGVLDRWKNKP